MPIPTTQDNAAVITVPSRPSSTTPDTATGSSGGKTRFVGKHSRDRLLSLYVQQRNIAEFAGTDESAVQPLQVIVRTNPELNLKSGERVYIGVLGRLVCDYGLQLAEHIIFQAHLPVYPALPASGATSDNSANLPKKKTFAESIFSRDEQFVGLPDDRHIAVRVKLPPGMPPSTVLLATGNLCESWGLAYYVCAFISGNPVSPEANSTTTWDRLRASRSGKVVLSFSRTLLQANTNPNAIPPTASNKRSSFTSSKAVTLKATLDRPAYRHSDPMTFSITLTNPKRASIVGLRITLKQIVTVRFAGEATQTIKSCYGRFDFHSVFVNSEHGENMFDEPDTAALRSRRSSYQKGVSIESLCRDACSFADSFTITPRLGTAARLPYQLALQSVLPRDSAPTSQCIATSCRFDGLVASIGGGLNQLRYFAVEYYANVHAVFRWSRNLIVKLPFAIYSDRLPAVEGIPPPTIARHPSAGNLHAESRSRRDTAREKPYDLIDLDDTDDDYLIGQTSPSAPKQRDTTALARNASVNSLASTMARSTISSPRHPSHDSNSDGDGQDGDLLTTSMSFKEDLQLAIQSLSGPLRVQLSSAQQSMLRQQCSEGEGNERVCRALQMELSACMHDLVDVLLPRLLLHASTAKDGAATKKSNVAMRVVNVVVDRLAPLHTRLIGKSGMERGEKEIEIDQLNKWLDTLEVLFARIAAPAANNVAEVATSLQQQALRLLLSSGDLKRVLGLMAAFCETAIELQAVEDAGLLFELVDPADCTDGVGDVWDGDLLAGAFQSLADSLVSVEEEMKPDRDSLFVDYLEQLCRHFRFFLNPSFTATDALHKAIQQAAFWHFHFASLSLCRVSALSAIGHMVKRSVLDPIKWSRSAMEGVPSYCSFITSSSNPLPASDHLKTVDEEEVQKRILMCGNLVIESMRYLGHLLSSSSSSDAATTRSKEAERE